MTDRELLELAAKAAGIEIDWQTPFVGIGDFAQFPHNAETGDQWNPLTDDGDALRLAVKLEMCVSTPFCYSAVAKCADARCRVTEQETGDDPYAATRRAIVRAAAEIGKEMGGYRIGMAEEAVIADLTAKLAESQAREKNLTARLDRFTRIAECGSSLGDDLDLWEKLVECQAREAKLRDALKVLMSAPFDYPDDEYQQDKLAAAMSDANKLLNKPNDDTALKEYRKKVLLEAADYFDEEAGVMWAIAKQEIRKMAEE